MEGAALLSGGRIAAGVRMKNQQKKKSTTLWAALQLIESQTGEWTNKKKSFNLYF